MTNMLKKVSEHAIRKITFCKKTYCLPPSPQPVQERAICQPVLTVLEHISKPDILPGRRISCKEG